MRCGSNAKGGFKSMNMTRLEKHLLLKLAMTGLKWVFCLALVIYTLIRCFFLPTAITLLWLFFTSFSCCENGYIPRYHYFLKFRFCHSYQERLMVSSQYESNHYIRIGEALFAENYLIWVDFGVVLHYSEINRITLTKIRNLNVVSVYLQNGKKYCFNISEPEFKSSPSLYDKAILHYESKKTNSIQ